MNKMKLFVVHPGKAHRDEFLAASMAMVLEEYEGPIERREPTADELADPKVLVLDVGMRHEPELNNFDHHQMERDAAPDCALSLYLKARGLHEKAQLFDWFETTTWIDSRGPFQTAKKMGLSGFPWGLLSPIEDVLLAEFEQLSAVSAQTAHHLHAIMQVIGRNLLQQINAFAKKIEELASITSIVSVSGVQGYLMPTTDIEGAGKLRSRETDTISFSLSFDDRGAGWCLYRFEDDPRIDFSRLAGDTQVLFAHAGGFIAKTRERLSVEDVYALVRKALV